MEPETTNSVGASMKVSTKILIATVVVLIVLGGGWAVTKKGKSSSARVNSSDSMELNTNSNIASNESAQNSGEGSLAGLWGMTGSHKCNVSMTEVNSNANGVVYVSNGKIRADFNVEVAQLGGKTMTSSMIQKDGEVFTWTNMYPQGFRAKVSANSDPLATSGAGGFNSQADVKYSCETWTSDESKFALPSGITFTTTLGQ